MLILHDPATLLHQTLEFLGAKFGPALECPDRLRSILKAIESSKHELRNVSYAEASSAQKQLLAKLLSDTHDPGYLEHLRTTYSTWLERGLIKKGDSVLPECFPVLSTSTSAARVAHPPRDVFARPGFYAFDMSSGLARHTWEAIEASAFLALEAVQQLSASVAGEERSKTVMALCRPPGHHCNTSKAGGYCYVNNAVVAVEAIRADACLGSEGGHSGHRIVIIDLDFHHGNGTQDKFYEDPEVLYTSIHGKDEFPYYTGFEDEIGRGSGEGLNVNFPLEPGSSLEQYLEKLDILIQRSVDFSPLAVVVSLGFDTFMLDPLGKFQIDTDDYAAIAGRVRAALKQIPAVILLEGGYVVDKLGLNLVSFLKGWEEGEGL